MNEEERQEQLSNIRMALGYTRKVLDTGQCDLLILDEIFGLIDYGIITMDDLKELLAVRDESTDLILTGRNLPEEIRDIADCIYYIHTEKEQAGEILHSGQE
jgi:cob(I)alamin adenosyltransferase